MNKIVLLGIPGSGKSTRPDVPNTFKEEVFGTDYLAFLKFIWIFNRDMRPAMKSLQTGAELIILRNRREVHKFSQMIEADL
ncbi:MAG: hypothetical protein LBN09_06725 [Clostridioides sp.]|jgi:hypothetical protein|nr:hypothetical protein [Clostridioides sp.]